MPHVVWSQPDRLWCFSLTALFIHYAIRSSECVLMYVRIPPWFCRHGFFSVMIAFTFIRPKDTFPFLQQSVWLMPPLRLHALCFVSVTASSVVGSSFVSHPVLSSIPVPCRTILAWVCAVSAKLRRLLRSLSFKYVSRPGQLRLLTITDRFSHLQTRSEQGEVGCEIKKPEKTWHAVPCFRNYVFNLRWPCTLNTSWPLQSGCRNLSQCPETRWQQLGRCGRRKDGNHRHASS